MADALCEAKWEGRGIFAKCISCFGLNGVLTQRASRRTAMNLSARDADSKLWLKGRSGKMHLGHSRAHDGRHVGVRRVVTIFWLDIADALCEAKWEDLSGSRCMYMYIYLYCVCIIYRPFF